ncbi:MAG: putative multi drug resistance-associated protein MRP, partial [Streblomastix strix]
MEKDTEKTVEQPKQKKTKKKINEKNAIRKPNLEDRHPFILNLFYCFFMPFICRIKPITNDDIYQIDEKDKCENVSNLVVKDWKLKLKQFLQDIQDFEKQKTDNPELQIKESSKPSLFKILLIKIGGIKLIFAYVFLLLYIGFQICQPILMKQVLKQVTLNVIDADQAKFPYSYAIILMFCPFLSSLFNTLQSRLIFHIASNVRSSLAGMIYRKVLKMNLSSQSNVNTGRIISLLSADTYQMALYSPVFFQIVALPVQIIIPMVFVIIDWGASALLSFAVILITFPIQGIISSNMSKAMRLYLQFNDERNKITNEVLQGIRVVKYSGLESIFIDRIEEVRNKQLGAIFTFTLANQSLNSIT